MNKPFRTILIALLVSLFAIMIAGLFACGEKKVNQQADQKPIFNTDTLYKRISYIDSGTTVKVDPKARIIRTGVGFNTPQGFAYQQVYTLSIRLQGGTGRELAQDDLISVN